MICTYPNVCKYYVEITKTIEEKPIIHKFCDKKAQFIDKYVDECNCFEKQFSWKREYECVWKGEIESK